MTKKGKGFHPDLYLWLAAVFAREQTVDSLRFLQSSEGQRFLREMTAAPGMRGGTERLLGVVARQSDLQDVALDLAVVFSRLFLGTGTRESSVSPYESAYTGIPGRLYQQATDDLEALLAEHGLSAAGTSEPADHISVELEFAARLMVEWLETGDPDVAARRRALVGDHLLVWAPQFCASCKARDPSGFYSAAADILQALLAIEADRLPV